MSQKWKKSADLVRWPRRQVWRFWRHQSDPIVYAWLHIHYLGKGDHWMVKIPGWLTLIFNCILTHCVHYWVLSHWLHLQIITCAQYETTLSWCHLACFQLALALRVDFFFNHQFSHPIIPHTLLILIQYFILKNLSISIMSSMRINCRYGKHCTNMVESPDV